MSNTDFDPDAYLAAAPPAAKPPVASPAGATPAFNPDAYLANPPPTSDFDPDAYLKSPVEPTPHQAYRASVKALSAGSPEQPAGVGAPQPTDFTSERVPPAELAKQWGDVAYGVPKGAAAFPAGGFMGDVESMGRHLVGAKPETYFPTTVEGGYLGPKGAGLMNPASNPEEAIGMGVGSMLLPGVPKVLRGLKGEQAPAALPEMPAALAPERSPLGVTLTEGELLNDPVKRAAEQRLIRQQDPHAQAFMEQRSAQVAQAPLETAPQLDPLGQVPAGSSIQAADHIANALEQHQDLVNQQLQMNTNLLAAAHEDFHNKLSPTGTTLAHDPMEAANVIQGAVDNEAQRAILAKNQAYKALEDSDVVFHPAAFNNAGNKMRALVDKADKIDINPETTPISNQAINKVDSILSSLVQKRDELGQLLPNEPITPGVIEDVRKRLNVFMGQAKASAQAGKPSDAIAMRSVLDAFDDLVEDRVAKGTVTQGNPLDALSQMRYARGLNTAYRKAFTQQGPGDAVGQAIQKILGRYDWQAATPEQIQGMMYSPKNPLSVKIANRLKSMFGETTPEFGAAKQGFNSFLTERPPGGEAWGPEQIADRIDQYTKGPGRSLTQAYLSPQEIGSLQTLGKASRQHASDLVAGESPFEGVDWQTTFRQAVNGSQKAVGQIDEALTRVGPTSPAGSTVRQGLFFNALQPVQNVEKWGFKQKADNLASLLQSTRNSAVYGPEHRQVIQSYIDLLRKLETPKGIWEPTGPAVDRLKMGIERGVGQLIGYTIARHIPGGGLAMDLIGMRLGGEGASFLARRNVNKIRTQLPIVADEMQKWQRAQARAAKNSNWATQQGAQVASTSLQKSLASLGIDFNKLHLSGTSTPGINFNQLQLPGGVAAEDQQQPKQRADGGATDDNPDVGSNYVTRHTAPFPEKPEGYEYIEAKGAGADTPGPATPSLSNGLETPVDTFLAHNPSPTTPAPDSVASGLPSPTGAEGGPGLPDQPAEPHTGPQTGMQKLFGVNGPRYQTWPEKMVRSGTTLAGDVSSGTEPDYTGLRREDFTDEPAPGAGEEREGGFWPFNKFAPLAAESQDPLIQRTQDMTALAGGSGFAAAEEGALGMAGGKLLPVRGAVETTPGYVYHATNAENALAIAEEGLTRHKPGDFTDQSVWPDGSVEKRNYFTPTAEHTSQFAPEEGTPVLLRVPKDAHPFKKESTGDLYSTKDVPTSKIEALTENGWQPLTTQLLSDTSKPGAALSALEHSQQPFYSTVENAIASAPQQKMHASQWAGWLKNQPGVTDEEFKWTGLGDWLGEQKGPVTKQQIANYVKDNKVDVQTVQKGELKFNANSKYNLPEVKKAVQLAGDNPNELELTLANDGDAYRALTKKFPELSKNEDWASVVANDMFGGSSKPPGTTKFGNFIKNKGNNYGETLLTMPAKPSKFDPSQVDIKRHMQSQTQGNTSIWYGGKKIMEYGDDPTLQPGGSYDQKPKAYWMDVAKQLYDKGDRINKVPSRSENFKSSHWDEPNVLANVLHSDRVIDGKKYLQLHELQSDWHQLGHAEGYKDPKQIAKVEANYNSAVNNFRDMLQAKPGLSKTFIAEYPQNFLREAERVSDSYFGAENKPSDVAGYNKYLSRFDEGPERNAVDQYVRAVNERVNTRSLSQKGVPDAPFKSNWHELAIKRMTHYAAENGYDGLLVDSGKTNADRYSLSKQVDSIQIAPRTDAATGEKSHSVLINLPDGNAMSLGVNKEGIVDTVGASNQAMKGKRLDEVVGKEIAARIMDQEGGGVIEGSGLEVGGEFHKKLYDQKIPQALNKLGKKYGAKIEEGTLPAEKPNAVEMRKLLDDTQPDEIALQKHKKEWDELANDKRLIEEENKNPSVKSSAIYKRAGLARINQIEGQLDKLHEASVKETIDRIVENKKGPPIHKFNITPELRKTAVSKGFPLFSDTAKPGAALSANKTQSDKQKVPRPIAQQPHSGQPAQEQNRAHGGRVNPENINRSPSKAQKENGNYAKDLVHLHGLEIKIENAKGSTRKGVDKNGKVWEAKLPMHYGYIRKTTGADQDHIDVYLGPHLKSHHIYLIDQVRDNSKKFDEHKILMGFGNQQQATNYYKRAFSDGKGQSRIGAIHGLTVQELKTWLEHGDTKAPFKSPQIKKLSHAKVGYEPKAQNMNHRCFNCVHFVPARHGGPECVLITSPVSPQAWCSRFRRKRL